MKKNTTIAIASIFAVTTLFAANQLNNPNSFNYNVDLERHASLDNPIDRYDYSDRFQTLRRVGNES